MAAYQVLLLNTAVPQIQAAQAGDTYVVPRDIAVTADLSVTGNTTLGNASTDTVQVNGYMRVGGGTPNANVAIRVSNTLTGAASAYGFYNNSVAASGVTSNLYGVASIPATAAAAFTLGNAFGFYAYDASKGAGSTITNLHGLYIADQTQGTNNYGITSLVSSGANKWNIYASGTAANYFAGSVGIGTSAPDTSLVVQADSPGIKLFTTNTSRADAGAITWAASTIGDTRVMLEHDESANVFRTSVRNTSAASWIEAITVDRVTGNVTINEGSVDADFRVESDTNTHAFFVQGSDGNVGIGTSSPFAVSNGLGLTVGSGVASSNARITINGGSDSSRGSAIRFERSGTLFGIIGNAGAIEGGTSSALAFSANSAGTVAMRIDSSGNLSLGGSANRATTVGTAALNIFDGTAPVGTLANGISLYSSSGEAYVMDAAGNATLFSPHDAETNEWIFKSKHTPTGKVLKIDVERLLRFVNDHFGLDAVKEFVEE